MISNSVNDTLNSMKKQVLSMTFFHRPGNGVALEWAAKIKKHVKTRYPGVVFVDKDPDVLVVLGGDGTILEAARKFHNSASPIILGLNIGTVGFLASVRKSRDFLKSLDAFLKGNYELVERMMVLARVKRNGKVVFTAEALNEIAIKSPLGMVELQALVNNHPVKHVRGTGLLVATATGSTAYNLSAHGPIVAPDIKCLIITEVLDHSIPSPSLVVKYQDMVNIKVVSYRKRGLISLSKTGKSFDVILIADGESIFPLEEKDEVIIQSFPHLVKFAELEKNYFFKSLQEKFGFR